MWLFTGKSINDWFRMEMLMNVVIPEGVWLQIKQIQNAWKSI